MHKEIKQHISLEQIKERGLVEKLIKWMFFNDKKSELEFASLIQKSLIHADNNYIYEPFSKWLTIGKMIEICTEPDYNIQIVSGYLGLFYNSVTTHGLNYKEETLCDALWEAVKAVLNE